MIFDRYVQHHLASNLWEDQYRHRFYQRFTSALYKDQAQRHFAAVNVFYVLFYSFSKHQDILGRLLNDSNGRLYASFNDGTQNNRDTTLFLALMHLFHNFEQVTWSRVCYILYHFGGNQCFAKKIALLTAGCHYQYSVPDAALNVLYSAKQCPTP